jgi:hypothetical protein
LIAHFKHFKIPEFELIARAVKTLFLGIFRGHLCDHCLLKQGKEVITSLSGVALKLKDQELKTKYPYMIESAYLLTIQSGIKSKKWEEFSSDQVIPDTIREFFKIRYVEITNKITNNSIRDLLKSEFLVLKDLE